MNYVLSIVLVCVAGIHAAEVKTTVCAAKLRTGRLLPMHASQVCGLDDAPWVVLHSVNGRVAKIVVTEEAKKLGAMLSGDTKETVSWGDMGAMWLFYKLFDQLEPFLSEFDHGSTSGPTSDSPPLLGVAEVSSLGNAYQDIAHLFKPAASRSTTPAFERVFAPLTPGEEEKVAALRAIVDNLLAANVAPGEYVP